MLLRSGGGIGIEHFPELKVKVHRHSRCGPVSRNLGNPCKHGRPHRSPSVDPSRDRRKHSSLESFVQEVYHLLLLFDQSVDAGGLGVEVVGGGVLRLDARNNHVDRGERIGRQLREG